MKYAGSFALGLPGLKTWKRVKKNKKRKEKG
jgi:hypothetical protein